MKKSEKIAFFFLLILIFLIFFLPLVGAWGKASFGNVTMDEVMFQLRMPLQGTNPQYFQEVLCICFFPALVKAVLVTGVLLFLYCKAAYFKSAVSLQIQIYQKRFSLPLLPCRLSKSLIFLICFLLLGKNLIAVGKEYKLNEYIQSQILKSTFIEETYVDPAKVAITFPEEKRNLIYIYLESMEVTYMDCESGGAFDENFIPELTDIAQNNLSFSGANHSGAYVPTSTGWTMGAMFAQSAGLPLKLPIQGNAMSSYQDFFPTVSAIGDILLKEGYRNYLCFGSDAVFGGRKNFYLQHGDYTILDYPAAIEEGRIPEDYYVWWGYEDQKLFSFAKEYLTDISSQNQPFNFTMLTVDTHAPDGYVCDLCKNEYSDQYANVLACNSRQLSSFIEWVQEQPFYENTTIVLCGDHCSMSPTFFKNLPKNYQRTVYNAFINVPFVPATSENRLFTTMDMFPTTLASIGATIEGDRLGLGTNLFSAEETLAEIHGLQNLNTSLSHKSVFYNNELLYKKKAVE